MKGKPMRRLAKSWVANVSAAALVMTMVLISPVAAQAEAHPKDPAQPATVTADALPTVQINGVVWSQVVIGNTVFAGGSFSNARPAGAAPGTQTTTRNNLLAYDITTGELIQGFAPSFNGQVLTVAASPDGSRLYVGGEFTTMNGQSASRLVALDPQTGQRISSFDPQPSNTVQSVIATNSTVYFGGSFFRVGAAWRDQVAAVRASDAALLTFRPVVAGGKVTSLALSPDGGKLAIGGQFNTVNGTTSDASALAVVRTDTSEKLPYPASAYVRNGVGGDGSITTLNSDSTSFYAGGFTFGRNATLEGIVAINWDDLDTKWLEDCHGDTYSVFATDSLVYMAGHPHYCGNIGGFPQETTWVHQRAMAFGKEATGTITREIHGYANFEGLQHPELKNWFPALSVGTYTGQNQGPWSVAGNDDYVVYGGEFLRANYKDQQGLVRFAVSDKAPNLRGPEPQGDAFTPTLTSFTSGEVRVRWQAAYDQDDSKLTYKVIRDGNNGNPVATLEESSNFWNRPGMSFTDSGLEPGSTHTYRIFAADPTGREARSQTVSITVASSSTSQSAYSQVVNADDPEHYWSLDPATGSGVADLAGDSDFTLTGNAAIASGATISGANGTAVQLGSGTASNPVRSVRTNEFTSELWFKASSSQRGRLIGYGNAVTGNSTEHDRLTYINSSGRISFGVTERGTKRVISSSKSYTDNKWHQVVSTLGPNGMLLYVDGELVASRASTTSALELDGYWRLGFDRMTGWSSAPSSGFAGLVDEVSIYGEQLPEAVIKNHYRAGTGATANVSPTAVFSAQTSDLTLAVDASASQDPDGSIVSYAWDFGDGGTSSAVSAEHSYDAAGEYTVKLTVTDNAGASKSATKQVTVTDPPLPNRAPEASFSADIKDLSVTLDATGSTDPDDDELSYSWEFGDGSANGSGAAVEHHYAEAGDYEVTLTVEDPDGASDSVSDTITVTEPAGPLIRDAFERNSTGGWGTADIGGPWGRTGAASTAFVSAGAGKILAANAGSGPAVYLPAMNSLDSEASVSLSLDKQPTGAGVYVWLSPRYQSNANQYALKLQISSSGGVTLFLCKSVDGTESILTSTTMSSMGYQAGQKLNLKVSAVGSSPTTLSAKIWKDGSAEPSAWQLSAQDSTASLQNAAGLGLRMYLSGSTTNAPIVSSFDDLLVARPE